MDITPGRVWAPLRRFRSSQPASVFHHGLLLPAVARRADRDLVGPLRRHRDGSRAQGRNLRNAQGVQPRYECGKLEGAIGTNCRTHAADDWPGELRRRIVRLGRSSAVIELQNMIWRLSELERRIKKAARRAKLKDKTIQARFTVVNPKESAVMALLPGYRRKMATLSELESKSANAEDEALLMLYSGETLQLAAEQVHVIQEIETGLQTLLRQLLDLRFAHPNRVTIAIYSENKDALFELARAYYKTAVGMQMQVTVSQFTSNLPEELLDDRGNLKKRDEDEEPKVFDLFGRKVVHEETNKPVEFLSHKPDACNAIVFRLDGESAFAMWALEYGLHSFVEGKTINPVFVHTSDVVKEYRPPSSLERRGAVQPANVGACRRTYKRAEMYVEDHFLATRLDWRMNLPAVLAYFLDQQVQRAAEKLIDE